MLVGAMLGDPAARYNVLYSEYDASREAICQIILPPGSSPPTWPLDKGHYWLRQVDMHNEADSSGNTNTVTAHDNVVDAAYYYYDTHDLAAPQTATSDNASIRLRC